MAERAARVGTVRALWRLVCFGSQALRGASICAFVFPFATPARRSRHVGVWSACMLRSLGIALHTTGAAQAGPALLVANHVSWLDILAIDAVRPVRFVAKADMRHWPLVGWMAERGGTLFIERERKRDALRVVHQVAEALRRGETVAIFPEGTTSDGHGVLPFHANLLQAAIATASPVQPVALRYRDRLAPVSLAAAYVGETSLVESLWRVARAGGLRIDVTLLPALDTGGCERRALAARLQFQISATFDTPS